MKFEWENIDRSIDRLCPTVTNRAKVIGGWIIHIGTVANSFHSQSLVFIPDPNHEWVIDK